MAAAFAKADHPTGAADDLSIWWIREEERQASLVRSFLGAISDEFHTRYESAVIRTRQTQVVASLRFFKVDLDVDLHTGETLPFVGSPVEPVHDRRNASV